MKNNLTVEKTFALAVKFYEKKIFHATEKIYKENLELACIHLMNYIQHAKNINHNL